MRTLFISDLHLTPSHHAMTEAFIRFMREDAPNADAVYILGDLFEFWVGDDDDCPLNKTVMNEIRTLVDSGTPCFFTQGNRDFLVGKKFEKKSGATLLGDETLIDLYGIPTLLLHGDTLCTDDVKYQKFRQKMHMPWLQWLYNRIPLSFRRKLVKKVQNNANSQKQTKSYDIMDVNQDAVMDAMQRHHAQNMIHGHTHRPNIHNLDQGKKRIVLGDWYTQASILEVTQQSTRLYNHPFSE
ncbi:UDP-2,3-diacylglucosamine diphosphatase [Vibrio sp. UCD-FRSSP16_10]|uniref:UDP-2,3-diacylglucosamine diphosphatase n=1 Tax=unclassified Vibrio TaxID=2614977 RepID=UPI0008010ECD|nr:MULTISPECIES: UDP-2,3-diacylglucosamine diphosphatase [unclassified Vibrio]OBT13906.1 UDP-2,3-diacylglucosamine diphosphatase [Vibrio sp. UCD-FRSSP16_30]OBT22787.1 UDP-2,3-diacylglucosamine diphosphatase [Vibrio sp. UCD-FRSSP16_10]